MLFVTMRLLLLCALAACSSKSSAGGTPADGEVAGVVLEVSGAVTAQSPGQSKARALRPGAELVAGDVIATEESASLRARLYHNRAVLVLAGGKMMALKDSPAWKATPAAGSPLEGAVDSDTTSVAGRHAENQGADTATTGVRPSEPAAIKPNAVEPVKPDPQPPAEPAEPKKPAPDGEDWGTIGETGSLAKDDVQKGMRELAPLLDACWKQQPEGAAVEFSYRLRVSVRPDGSVKSVEIDEAEGSPPAQVTRCVVDAVKKVSFPRSKRGVTFTYPVQFKHQ
jgi:TonB family protein